MTARGILVLGVVAGLLATVSVAGAQSVTGQATAATVNTPPNGVQTFANASLAPGGNMNTADLDGAAIANVLSADGLRSITNGQIDDSLVTVTASAEAADVNILNGLISAKALVAFASSYATGSQATSEANGSTLLGLVANGVAYADGAPAPNTRIDLPGVGYVILNEQIATGDGVHSSGLTINMIHVFLTDPVTGASTGEIVAGSAHSAANL